MHNISTYFWGRVVQPAINLVKHDKTIKFLREIKALPFMSESETYEYQCEKLRNLMHHCYNNVPYYRDLFKKTSLTPQDFKTLEDIEKLPILTRDIINKNPHLFIANNIPNSDLFPKSTGGSTGTPLNIFYDRNYWHRGEAGTLRSFSMAGYEIGEPVVIVWAYPENLLSVPYWQQTLRQKLRRRFYFDANEYGPEEMNKWAQKCKSLKPTIIYGYASAIYHFARFIKLEEIAITSIKGVFTTSEKLYQFQKETIQDVFNCKVYDNYGCAETLHLAFECPEGKMHRACDFSYIETEYDSNKDSNFLIVTSLWNYGFPIVRYRNHDIGNLIDDKCTCGRGFPLFDLNITRIFDNVIAPNGNIIHGTSLMHLLYGSEGIDRYQFYQPDINTLILYILKGPDFSQSTADWLSNAQNKISILSQNSINLIIEYVESIPTTKAGKHLYIRSDIYKENQKGKDHDI